ncbi:MAG TPA: glycosyltransferase family 1 protein [Chthoniobacterales bacterium]|jgi:glycosyltransferase involved in cell wall biosynthesis|nr:glycosyltransferase family 1 protein [Chthoniobacterales bacterium]
MVLLIGNYPLDRQQSMQRFGTMMLHGLNNSEITAKLIAPKPRFGKFRGAGSFVAKWLGYIDKFVFFPRQLRATLAEDKPSVVHICDHSNSMYGAWITNTPVVVTCHDLLAVRGALGEETNCPASLTGKILQRWILRGLRRVNGVACVSQATQADVRCLISRGAASPKVQLVRPGLNYPFRRLPEVEVSARLAKIPDFNSDFPFVLHVGSNLRRKNRDGVLRIFALCKEKWNARLVFVGDTLTSELFSLAETLGIFDRITQLPDAPDELLEALYNRAVALLYPSRFEGFGWPVIEAQACGCPVVCSNSGPLPETAGDAALFHDPNDETGFAADLLRLSDPEQRAIWSEKSLRNAERFSTSRMVSQYIDIYRSLGAQL